jgi:hypothetical protein
MKRKCLVVGIILLFIGVSVAPSINTAVVKASNDNDLVEVTSQACGVQGFGNTTVKLTKEQYQDLEQYLVDFRARLNQTSTREEAVPLFKDAVVELNKYGLLPKGIGVEQAQKLISGPQLTSNKMELLKRVIKNNRYGLYSNQSNASNYFCFVAVTTTAPLYMQGNLNLMTLTGVLIGAVGIVFFGLGWRGGYNLAPIGALGLAIFLIGLIFGGYGLFKIFLPLSVLTAIGANANYSTSGLLGTKKGFSPAGINMFVFTGIEIKSKTVSSYLGWAVATFSF